MGGYRWRGDDGEERAKEVAAELAAIREIAAERTGWTPEMTEDVGYGASLPVDQWPNRGQFSGNERVKPCAD